MRVGGLLCLRGSADHTRCLVICCTNAVREMEWGFGLIQSVLSGGSACVSKSSRATENRNLLLLLSDDFLRQTPELVVMAVLELGLRHVDRAPMLWDHNGREVAIDIASRRDEHLSARVADRQVIGEKELLLLSLLCC
jgi:hypothetical protein